MSETTYSPEFMSLQRVVAGRYSLVREIGRGGMGIVFLAERMAAAPPKSPAPLSRVPGCSSAP